MPRARAVLAVAMAAAACSSVKVQSEWDRAANFKGYKTYAWITQQPGPEQAPPARDPRIREAAISHVNAALKSKGLALVESGQSPDLLVAVHGWAVNRIDVRSYGYAYGPSPYYGMYPTLATGGVDVRQYRDGTLIIDLIDSGTHQMVWRGTATDTFDPGAEAKTVANAIDKTLDQYPPPATN
ncbi:MAG TPA: DUF4136 domain-containing protein [Myxococcales bacterium]|nr:DUF4136 domain-containing protein [Myxococcales bacterium]